MDTPNGLIGFVNFKQLLKQVLIAMASRLERYRQLSLAAQIAATHTSQPVTELEGLFAKDAGYATPKIDVRELSRRVHSLGSSIRWWLDTAGRMGRPGRYLEPR